jgi:hypothetical protein
MNDKKTFVKIMKMNNIFVFKTSVNGNEEVRKLRPELNRLINRFGEWNFDLEDCDRILRVEARNLEAVTIRNLMRLKGYECEELPG